MVAFFLLWPSTAAEHISTLKTLAGKEENVEKARAAFFSRCKANSEATFGAYKGDAVKGEGVSESLNVKDNKY